MVLLQYTLFNIYIIMSMYIYSFKYICIYYYIPMKPDLIKNRIFSANE